MKSLRIDRCLCFGLAFLVINVGGWWWVKSGGGGTGSSKVLKGERSEAGGAVSVLKPLAVVRLEQVALSPERLQTLAFTFSGPVDWPSFGERLKLTADGQPVAWRFFEKNRVSACQIQTQTPIKGDRINVRIEAGVKPASRDYAALDVAVSQPVPVVPEFLFSKLDTETPSFGQPAVIARFTQMADPRDTAALITCSPPVPLVTVPEPWGNGVRMTGPFVIGTSYTFTFKAGLRSRSGHRLEKEVRRTVLIQHRVPSLSIPVEGRYLAPKGNLTVPVLAVNTTNVVSSLARVLPQNLVQYAMREAGLYSGWWRDEASVLSKELTVRAVVRTNLLTAARDQEQRLMLKLGEYGPEPLRGVYVLTVSAPDVRERSRLVCVTDIGLSARCDEEAVTVWTTALRTGLPLSDLRVELYGRNNELLVKGASDAKGLVRLSHPAEHSEPFLIVAQTRDGSDMSALALTDNNAVEQRGEASRGYLAPEACEAFLMSDRDIYRHGENVFVQALLRKRDGRPPVPFPVVLHVVKPDGRTFKTFPLMPDALGAVVTQVTLPAYLPSGTYDFELRLPGDGPVIGQKSVMGDAFVPPHIRVKVLELPVSVRADGELAFKVSAEHLFGKPAAGLTAEASLICSATEFKPESWKGYRFGDAEKKLSMKVKSIPRQILAEDGTASFSVKVAVDGLPPAQVKAVVQAMVTETSGRDVAAQATVKIDPYPFYIGLDPGENKILRVGSPRKVALAAVNPDGSRHVETTPLEIRIERVAWLSAMRKDPSGNYQWESERVKTLVSEAKTETGSADTAYTFSVEASGDYLITFTDPVSRASTSWPFVAGEEGQAGGSWDRASPDRVELVFDKPEYRPGETARLQLRAPFTGQAWVSLNNANILENRIVSFTNNTAMVEWPVTDVFVPSVEVAVTLVRPAVAESVWSAHRASGEALLLVRPQERKLTVKVGGAAEVWRPKSVLPVSVSVTDAAGAPARGAGVTVLAVDEGVCLLTDYETPDPYGFFLEARSGNLCFYDVYRNLMPITSEAMFGAASHVGGDGGDEMLKRLNPVAARRFKPLALWQANVKADEAGHATVSFEVPEFAGELRLMAVAWNVQAVGSAAGSVKIKRKLVVQPDLPRFLAPGDQTQVQVTLHNESGDACTARVSLRTEGPLTCAAAVKEIPLKTGESLTVPMTVAAREQAGTAQVFVKVEGAGEVYEEPIELAVRPASALRVTAEHGVLQPGEEKSFTPPQGVLEESFSQTFFCSAQPSVNLLGALDYVVNYPYGCLEQTVSSALPLLTLGELAKLMPSKESTLAQEAPDRINAALLRVLSMQRWDGFAMWPDIVGSSPEATVYAAFFLVQAAQAGYALPKESLAEVLKVMRNQLPDGDDVSRAYVCHVLALAGQPDHAWMLRLYEQAESLKMEDRFHLARALIRSGEAEKGRELLERAQSVRGLREASFALLAWLEVDPKAPFVAVCCQEIERVRRSEGHWGSTHDNALALLALGDYVRHTPGKTQLFAPKLSGAGQTRDMPATNAFTWLPGKEADRGAVQIRNAGPGPMYVTRRVSCVPLAANEAAADSGLQVRREWLDQQGTVIDPHVLQRGDVVIVRLTLDPLGRECRDVVIDELLPACLEIENALMATTGGRDWIKEDEAAWVLHREVRDDRLLLFSKALSKKKCFHYAARVVSPGVFVVPPVSAAAMYDPQTFSRHGRGQVTVK
ncbi:MAG: MG2 domain-containing protein [bacterium]